MDKVCYDELLKVSDELKLAKSQEDVQNIFCKLHTITQRSRFVVRGLPETDLLSKITRVTVDAMLRKESKQWGRKVNLKDASYVANIIDKSIRGKYFSDYNGPVFLQIVLQTFENDYGGVGEFNARLIPVQKNGQVIIFKSKEEAIQFIYKNRYHYFSEISFLRNENGKDDKFPTPDMLLDQLNNYTSTYCLDGGVGGGGLTSLTVMPVCFN